MKFNTYFYYLIVTLFLTIAFNNCSDGFQVQYDPASEVNISSLSKPSCEDELMTTYNTTYYYIFSNNCKLCHKEGGRGLGVFGSDNLKISYDAFKSIGTEKINSRIIDDTHQPPYTGVKNKTILESAKSEWIKAVEKYDVCVQSTATINTTDPDDILLNDLPLPAGTISQSSTNTNFRTLTWDLSKDVENKSLNRFGAFFSIELRAFIRNSVVEGLELRNPTFQLKSAVSSFFLGGLGFYYNGQKNSNITTYLTLNTNITSTTSTNVASGTGSALVVIQGLRDGDKISFSLIRTGNVDSRGNNGGTGTGGNGNNTTITFTQLISSTGIFTQRCANCHNSTTARGGLNITNFTQASSKSSTILDRMKSAASPMPPSGLLPTGDIDMIQKWVDGGKQQ